jgi:hypothetical protein
MGGNRSPELVEGNAEGAKLPCRYIAEKSSPKALELKKSPPSLRKYGLCKNLIIVYIQNKNKAQN